MYDDSSVSQSVHCTVIGEISSCFCFSFRTTIRYDFSFFLFSCLFNELHAPLLRTHLLSVAPCRAVPLSSVLHCDYTHYSDTAPIAVSHDAMTARLMIRQTKQNKNRHRVRWSMVDGRSLFLEDGNKQTNKQVRNHHLRVFQNIITNRRPSVGWSVRLLIEMAF